jgi:hypothetical protein
MSLPAVQRAEGIERGCERGCAVLIVPNNWTELQHYKDRSPPWIKLHKKLLDNYDFQCLPVASRALAPMLWLLASEHEKGEVDAEPKKLAFRLRMSEQEAAEALKPLMDKEFFSEVRQAASKPLAKPRRAARPETETETETEVEKRREEGEQVPAGFARFWSAWPKSDRKGAKGKCLESWVKGNAEPHAERIVAHVERLKASAGWKKNNGEFIPAPLVYLNQRKWEGVDEPAGSWWLSAGFSDKFEAENHGCYERNASQFHDGKRDEVTA